MKILPTTLKKNYELRMLHGGYRYVYIVTVAKAFLIVGFRTNKKTISKTILAERFLLPIETGPNFKDSTIEYIRTQLTLTSR